MVIGEVTSRREPRWCDYRHGRPTTPNTLGKRRLFPAAPTVMLRVRTVVTPTVKSAAPPPVHPPTSDRRWHAWLPGVATLLRYQRGWLPHDVVAGLGLTAVLVPVGMGYAEASGIPAIYGLYATIVPLLVYALLGPSRIMVLGPDSTLAAVIAALIVPLAGGNMERSIALAGLLAILSGSCALMIGLLRLGLVADLLSKPIRIGFLNAIAVSVIIEIGRAHV